MEDSISRKYLHQETIIQFSRSALEGLEPLSLMDKAVNLMTATLQIEFGEVLEFLHGSEGFLMRSGVGWGDIVGKVIINQEDFPQAAQTLSSTRPVLVENFGTDERFSQTLFLKKRNIISGITCIIPGKKNSFGILGAHSLTPKIYTQDEINFVESICHVLSWAIRRKDAEEKLIHFAEELERNRDKVIKHSQKVSEMNRSLELEITERKRAEEKTKESESRLDAVVNTAVDTIIVIDENGIIQLFNPAAERLFGYSTSEVFDQNVKMLMPEPYRTEHDGYMNRYKETGKAHIIGIGREVIGLRKDKTTFDMDLAISEMNWRGNRVFLGIIRDISERNHARKQLEEYANNLEQMVRNRTEDLQKSIIQTHAAKNQIDAILKSIGDGLIVTDNENRVILMNKAAQDLFDKKLSDVINEPIEQVIQEEDLLKKFKIAVSHPTNDFQFDFELGETSNKNPITIQARTSKIKNSEGSKLGNVTTMNDVTKEREIDRMKTEFISTAAHEFQTPLTSIRGFSEILLTRDNIDSKDKTNYLTFIHEESQHLTTLVSDLLDLSKIESGQRFILDKTNCNILETIRSIITLFKEQSDRHSFCIESSQKEIIWPIDKEKMEGVFKNLYSNAIKYSPKGGEIKTVVKILESEIQFSIQDHGLGMSADQVDKIFDKFYRADSSNTAIQGTGLGMTIVKYILEAHYGKIWIDTELSKGTTIYFTIPN
jgi:PAS domain S-box-containing protein